MSAVPPSWLALDVGGANLKAAHTSGEVRSVPFALWTRPEALAPALAGLGAAMPRADRVALTMTAELCDCYPTKADGVRAVLEATVGAFDGRTIRVWGTDGGFHDAEEIGRRPQLAAAANWLALAVVAARLIPEGPGLLVDVGSTTADVIPLHDGRPVPRGRVDTERLQAGELVYAGVRRTPVFALAAELPLRGTPTPLAAERFATTQDVYLLRGDLAPDPADRDTADGRPATVEAARDRLARVVCGDRDSITEDDALGLARAADAALLDRLVVAARRACKATIGRPRGAVVAGSGEFLARRVAERVVGPGGRIVSLASSWGPDASAAACARALAILAREDDGGGGPA